MFDLTFYNRLIFHTRYLIELTHSLNKNLPLSTEENYYLNAMMINNEDFQEYIVYYFKYFEIFIKKINRILQN